MDTTWKTFNCPGSTRRWRYLPDGRVEIGGEGVPERTDWPAKISTERRPLVEQFAAKHALPAAWLATIMAMETRGETVCRTLGPGLCYGPTCTDCLSSEGAGLMATKPATATAMLGRPVSARELMRDDAVAVDAGAAYLRYQLGRYESDFVKAAVGYNAGSVRCGQGKTYDPEGGQHEPCPDPGGWGVIVGCVYSARGGPNCAPSPSGRGPYICTSDYARNAIRFLNAAVRYYGAATPVPPLLAVTRGISAPAGLALAAAAAGAGWFAASWLWRRRAMRGQRRRP